MTRTHLLTMPEVRERLRIGHGSLYRLLKTDPDFKTLKVGGRRYMREEALEKYLRAREAAEA
jgi:predicted DNA-binding transcriptional regulator AlpA